MSNKRIELVNFFFKTPLPRQKLNQRNADDIGAAAAQAV
jgi:hypothetical protein